MQCLKTDTLLIFDYEELNSEKNRMYSSLDTLNLSCKKVKQKKSRRHYKNKYEHRRRGHQTKKNKDSVITKCEPKEKHNKKEDLKYITSLDTAVDQKESLQKNCNVNSSKDLKSHNIERPVPHCLKKLCQRPRHHSSSFHRHSKERHLKTGLLQRRDMNGAQAFSMVQPNHTHNKCRHSRHDKRSSKLSQKPKEPELIISPKNRLLLKDPDYEEISTKSLDSYLDIPSSYKHVKTYKNEYYESKLDTLIKRSKERERKLVEQSRQTGYTSTPVNTDISSTVFPISCSEIDVSLYSQSTLILEPQDYGIPIKGYYSDRSSKYSTFSSGNEDNEDNEDYLLKLSESGKNIKLEPMMDIEAYSPTQSPDVMKWVEIDDEWVKKEIKIESKEDKL